MSPSTEHPSIPVDAADLDLLRRFEPVVRYTKGEQFFPTRVEPYIEQCSLWAHYPDGRDEPVIKEGELDLERLVEHRSFPFGTVEYLKFNEPIGIAESARVLAEVRKSRRETGDIFRHGPGRWARGGFLPRIVDTMFSLSLYLRGRVPSVVAAEAEVDYNKMLAKDERYTYYGRVVRQNGWTILQYWFFFCYNSWRSGFKGVNDHESDWEMIVVYLYEDQGCLLPEWVAYASHDYHGDDLRRRWDDRTQLDLIDGHPVVYAGAGSHASYFRPGEYQAEVGLPAPEWLRGVFRSLGRFWSQTLGQGRRESRDPFRIPFIDYARGDGLSVGPTQEKEWSPEVIAESTPWVSQYRGLWGLFAHDPISGENAPAGPMYDRGGSPRGSWYDPLGFAGLDKEPPPPLAIEMLEAKYATMGSRLDKLQELISNKAAEVQAAGVELRSMEGNPHLAKQHALLARGAAVMAEELRGLRRESSDNEALREGMRRRLTRLRAGGREQPHAHVRHMAMPVSPVQVRFGRAAAVWSAISLSLILFGFVALLILARPYAWMGLVLMAISFVVLESVLRGAFARTIASVAVILTLITVVLLIGHLWFWILVVLLGVLAAFLIIQRLREIRG